MTPSSLVDVLDAIVAGLATVTNLSTAAVSKYDYRMLNLPYSVVVTPAFEGAQSVLDATPSYLIVHRVRILLTVSQRGDVQDLLRNVATQIPLILAWFRAHLDLGLADCVGWHLEPLTWTAAAEIGQADGVLSKDVVFVVAVALTV
jgi:hypothetical protein